MRLLKLVPDNTNIGFVRIRHIAFTVTALLTVAAMALVFVRGLNLGVDFVGGVAIEETFTKAPPLDEVRSTVDRLGVGEATLQQIGSDTRAQRGSKHAAAAAIHRSKSAPTACPGYVARCAKT